MVGEGRPAWLSSYPSQTPEQEASGGVYPAARQELALLFDAPEVLEGPDEDLAVGNRDRGVGLFAAGQRVGGQYFELRAGGQYERVAVAHEQVEPAVGVNHRTPGRTLEPLLVLPQVVAGLQLVAVRHRVLIDHVDVFADDHPRSDALGRGRLLHPEPVRRDVVRPAKLHGEGRTAEAGHAHGHTVADNRRCVDVAVVTLALPEFLAGLRVETFQVTPLRLRSG